VPAEAITSESLRQLYGVEVVVTEVDLGAGMRRSSCLPVLPRQGGAAH